MRGMRFALAGLLVAGMFSLAQAQFRPGGFGGGGVSFLVSNKAVQEDLKLSEEQITKLKDWSEGFKKKAEEINKEKGVERGKGFEQPSAEQQEKRAAANAEITKVAYKELADVLKKEQIDRLKQIQHQQQGTAAFTSADVVEALKLTPAQKDSVKGITGDLAKETKEIRGEPTKGKFDFEKFQETQKKVQKLQKEYMGKLEDLLDDSQKKIWADLKGPAFDLTKLQPQPPKKKD